MFYVILCNFTGYYILTGISKYVVVEQQISGLWKDWHNLLFPPPPQSKLHSHCGNVRPLIEGADEGQCRLQVLEGDPQDFGANTDFANTDSYTESWPATDPPRPGPS